MVTRRCCNVLVECDLECVDLEVGELDRVAAEATGGLPETNGAIVGCCTEDDTRGHCYVVEKRGIW